MHRESRSTRARKSAVAIGALVVVAVILWIDVATGLWQEFVIVAGLAAGLVTFLLTVLVLDKILERSTAKRWAPVNRLALSEFLHALADEEQSEITHGKIIPRTLPVLGLKADDPALSQHLHELRLQVLDERRMLADALSRWASFLAASGDNQAVLRHVADISMQFDQVRDATLEAEETPTSAALTALQDEIVDCNTHIAALEQELLARLEATRG